EIHRLCGHIQAEGHPGERLLLEGTVAIGPFRSPCQTPAPPDEEHDQRHDERRSHPCSPNQNSPSVWPTAPGFTVPPRNRTLRFPTSPATDRSPARSLANTPRGPCCNRSAPPPPRLPPR